YYTKALSDDHLLSPDAVAIPIWLRSTGKDAATLPNLSQSIKEYLAHVNFDNEKDGDPSETIWMHVLAVGYAPSYLTENADGIRQDWPRIPLPKSKQLLMDSARLGRKVAELLNTDGDIVGVTAGAIRPELTVIATITRQGGGTLNENMGELALKAG